MSHPIGFRPGARPFIVAAAALCAGLSGPATALEAPGISPKLTDKARPSSANLFTKACPDMTRGFSRTQGDGGTLNGPQGWLFKADVQNAPNGYTYLICSYGRHSRQDLRASIHVYDVSYQIPTGIRAEQCQVQGAGVTCTK